MRSLVWVFLVAISATMLLRLLSPARGTPTFASKTAKASIQAPPVSNGTPLSTKACLQANGVAFGLFRDGQGPDGGVFPEAEQIKEDLQFVSRLSKRIRIYGTNGTYSEVPHFAHDLGLSVMQGIWLDSDEAKNKEAIAAALSLARQGLIESIIVGNETLTGKRLSKQRLIEYIREVKRQAPAGIPISIAETWDIWKGNPDLAKDVDFVVAHFYPFWENHAIEGAADNILTNYKTLKSLLSAAHPGRNLQIVIGETGWPSAGTPSFNKAKPSPENQRKFFEAFTSMACSNSIPFYYFSVFDEEWKWREGSSMSKADTPLPKDRTFSGRWVGSSWGLFSSTGRLKPQLSKLLDEPDPGSRSDRDIFVNDGQLSLYYGMGVDTSKQRRDWLGTSSGALMMSYPAGQEWGSVFITVGNPGPRRHPSRDFSEFEALSVELKGAQGGESVEIGIMDSSDPATGTERKCGISNLSTTYQQFTVPLTKFASTHLSVPEDLKHLYVVIEFVFPKDTAETVYARNIRYTARIGGANGRIVECPKNNARQK